MSTIQYDPTTSKHSRMVWTVDLSLKLVNMYRQAPCLWDSWHADFKNRIVRNAVLTKMAREFDCSTIDIDKKIRSLRAQFGREHIREMNGLKSCWYAYVPLKFLLKIAKKKSTDAGPNISTIPDNSQEYYNTSQTELITKEETVRPDDVLNERNDDIRVVSGNIVTDTWNKSVTEESKILSNRTKLDSLSNSNESYYGSYQAPDEYTSFADCVAHKLRSINDPRARSVAQYVINSVLFQAEMTNYYDHFEHVEPQELIIFRKAEIKSLESEK